ncbi:MAG: hypothetical protein LBT03_01765 [Holosporales bacterium]|jgi:hypothetical protein|nr:hypothetical protein [Holosporales bacterium]
MFFRIVCLLLVCTTGACCSDDLREITRFDVIKFWKHRYGRLNGVREKCEWEHFINKGKPGPQLFLVDSPKGQYVVKASERIGEYDASVKFWKLTIDGRIPGKLNLVYPMHFAIVCKRDHEAFAFISLQEASEGEVTAFRERLDDEEVILFEIMPKIDGRTLGQLMDDFDKMTVEQLEKLGNAVGEQVARFHRIWYSGKGDGIVHGDMHPGQIILSDDFSRCVIMDLDKTRQENIVIDLFRIVGTTIQRLNNDQANLRLLAYIWGFLEGYGAILPGVLNLNNNWWTIDLFSVESFIGIVAVIALVFRFFEPLHYAGHMSFNRKGHIPPSHTGMWQIIGSNLKFEKKKELLSRRTTNDKYECALQIANTLSNQSLHSVIERCQSLQKAYNRERKIRLSSKPDGEWLNEDEEESIMWKISEHVDDCEPVELQSDYSRSDW